MSIKDAKILRKTKNLQLQCSLDPNYSKDCKGISQSQPASNQNQQDPLGIL